MTNDTGIIIDTPEGISAVMLLSIRATLRLEVNTGMKFSNRVSPFKQAKAVLTQAGIKPKGTKAAVLAQLNEYMDDLGLPNARA